MVSKCFSEWGPYSKKYMGLSHIANHKFKSGVRFDFTVLPAVFGMDVKIPNVTVPSGVHPWLCSPDYSFYSYRYDLEWKDRIYADVSFSRIDENSTLVRTEIVNNSEIMGNFLVNYFSSIEYPYPYFTRLITPSKCVYKDALDYDEYEYNTPRPWDKQNPDGMKKGQFRSPDFVNENGLGDRVDKWHMPHRVIKPFGAEKGDRVSYALEIPEDYENALLFIRYRTSDIHYEQGKMVGVHYIPGESDATFLLNGKEVVFSATDKLDIKVVEFGKLTKGEMKIELVSVGTGAVELDFLCVIEEADIMNFRVYKDENNFMPEITEEKANDCGYISKLKYQNVNEEYILRTFSENTRYRKIPTGSLEDCMSARLSNADVSFDDVTESFTGAFKRKHSDDGFFHNAIVHTIFVESGETRVEYAVVSLGETEYKTLEEYEEIYKKAKSKAVKFNFNESGKKYELSNNILGATLLTNAVYPIYKHGENIIHHTPGKRWDCLYTWDSGFIGLGMTLLSKKFADYSLDTYFTEMDNPDYAFLLHGSPVPVQMYLYSELLKENNDKEKLLEMYPRAKRFYEFLVGRGDGSTTAKFKSGLTTTYDYFYSTSGMDDYPAQVQMMNDNVRDKASPVISSSQVIRCGKILKMVATALGKTKDAEIYSQDIERITKALHKYSWDEDSGYFSYVLHDENYEPKEIFRTYNGENVNKGLDGIYPIIAGACTKEQSDRILGHLKSEKEMLSPYGISAVDMSAGYFKVNGYWNGHVWFPHQWFIWKTMLDMGESDFAFEIAERALNIWKREVEYSYYTFEMVNVVTGKGGWFHNFGGLSSPINLWSAAYYKPGTFNTGLDTWVDYQEFNEDNTSFKGKFKYFGNNEKFTVIVTLSDKIKDYKVTVNGVETACNVRDNSAVEVTINGGVDSYEITVNK